MTAAMVLPAVSSGWAYEKGTGKKGCSPPAASFPLLCCQSSRMGSLLTLRPLGVYSKYLKTIQLCFYFIFNEELANIRII